MTEEAVDAGSSTRASLSPSSQPPTSIISNKQSKQKRKRKSEVDLAITDYLKSKPVVDECEESDFGRCVAKSVEKLPDRQRHIAKAKIMDVLRQMHEEVHQRMDAEMNSASFLSQLNDK